MSYNALSRDFNPLPAVAVLPLFAGANRGREILTPSRLRRTSPICRGKQGERNRALNWSFWELEKFFGMQREELDNVHFMRT